MLTTVERHILWRTLKGTQDPAHLEAQAEIYRDSARRSPAEISKDLQRENSNLKNAQWRLRNARRALAALEKKALSPIVGYEVSSQEIQDWIWEKGLAESLVRNLLARISQLERELEASRNLPSTKTKLDREEAMISRIPGRENRAARRQRRRRPIEDGNRTPDEIIGPPGHAGPKISLDRVWNEGLRALRCEPPPGRWPPSVNRRNFGRELITLHGQGGVHQHIGVVGASAAVADYLAQHGVKCTPKS